MTVDTYFESTDRPLCLLDIRVQFKYFQKKVFLILQLFLFCVSRQIYQEMEVHHSELSFAVPFLWCIFKVCICGLFCLLCGTTWYCFCQNLSFCLKYVSPAFHLRNCGSLHVLPSLYNDSRLNYHAWKRLRIHHYWDIQTSGCGRH